MSAYILPWQLPQLQSSWQQNPAASNFLLVWKQPLVVAKSVCRDEEANDVARALRNMDYGEITQMEKELNIRPNLDEVSSMSGDDSQPDGGYLPKGHVRKLGADDGVNKGDDWFHNGGYIQLEFPEADSILGDDDANQIYIRYVTKNVPRESGPKTKFTKKINKLNKELEMSDYIINTIDDFDIDKKTNNLFLNLINSIKNDITNQ